MVGKLGNFWYFKELWVKYGGNMEGVGKWGGGMGKCVGVWGGVGDVGGGVEECMG